MSPYKFFGLTVAKLHKMIQTIVKDNETLLNSLLTDYLISVSPFS